MKESIEEQWARVKSLAVKILQAMASVANKQGYLNALNLDAFCLDFVVVGKGIKANMCAVSIDPMREVLRVYASYFTIDSDEKTLYCRGQQLYDNLIFMVDNVYFRLCVDGAVETTLESLCFEEAEPKTILDFCDMVLASVYQSL